MIGKLDEPFAEHVIQEFAQETELCVKRKERCGYEEACS